MESPEALTVISGPTASGKSRAAVELAEKIGAEIVGADSQQVYKYFDLGTAKPEPELLARVPHHLISVVEPLSPFSAAKYQALADAAIADIHARGKRVVVAGGTGLYLRILLRGLIEAPGADEQLREELEAFADREGNPALHQRLAAVDPESAKKLEVADRVRVIRALEIFEATGKPASQQRQEHAFARPRYAFKWWVLSPPREKVYEAINQRTRWMFEHGLVDEARSLAERGFREAAPMRSVGYVEALAVADGKMTLEAAINDTAQRTRHYAKRQVTWFKRETDAVFVEKLLS
ncbi:MAG: tRNA (adenosine(37)-N6)-dimethylallyltransferase MiaA [Myxococcaceae bacterium]